MTEHRQTRADVLTTPPPPAYVLILIAETGAVLDTVRISAEDDDQGREQARARLDGHAVELWDGVRFIEHFPARR